MAFCPSSQVEITTVAITLSHQVEIICLNTNLSFLYCLKVAFTFLSLSQPQMNAGTAVVINKPFGLINQDWKLVGSKFSIVPMMIIPDDDDEEEG